MDSKRIKITAGGDVGGKITVKFGKHTGGTSVTLKSGGDNAEKKSGDLMESAHMLSVRIQDRVMGLDAKHEYGTDMVDYSRSMPLKADHGSRPLWVLPTGLIVLDATSPIYQQAYDFLVAIAEPQSRPEFLHQWQLTPYSLYAAVSVSLETESIIQVLERLSKAPLPAAVTGFIRDCTSSYGKAKLVLRQNRTFVESHDPAVLRALLEQEAIAAALIKADDEAPGGARGAALVGSRVTAADGFHETDVQEEEALNQEYKNISIASMVEAADKEAEQAVQAGLDMEERMDSIMEAATVGKGEAGSSAASSSSRGGGGAGRSDDSTSATAVSAADMAAAGGKKKGGAAMMKKLKMVSFEVDKMQVEHVKKAALKMDCPLMEEYDFKSDRNLPDLPIDLKPTTRIRSYQEKSLSKMFGNGRARSGILVLPCGAGKTLVGVTAAATVKKGCICLCTSGVAVQQWKHQFQMWTKIADKHISVFTSDQHDPIDPNVSVLITTYTMLSHGGKRAVESSLIMEQIAGREWGLMVLDEVHVVPAATFRKVIGIASAHCKLGLSATLVREDDKIGDLNFLIGPKLYEANWMDLTQKGFLARVQCSEVWCPMTPIFFRQYLEQPDARKREALYVMNPNKFKACEYLVNYHKAQGDKIIVFSDNVFALKHYSEMFSIPYIFGGTSEGERMATIRTFKSGGSACPVIAISKVGDVALDMPEATVIIQISSHFGARRQEAQRLGRVLRPNKGMVVGEVNAHFYTLVSTDTQEMFYSNKRRQYLIDQGYTYKVIQSTTLVDELFPSQHLNTKEDELTLLSHVLEAEIAKMEADESDKLGKVEKEGLFDKGNTGAMSSGATRRKGTLAGRSGGVGARYKEKKRDPATRHKLFRKRK